MSVETASRMTRHSDQVTGAKNRRWWVVVAVVAAVAIAGAAYVQFFMNGSKVDGVPASFPVVSSSELSNEVRDEGRVSFVAEVATADELPGAIAQLEAAGFTLDGKNEANETTIYALSKGELNASVVLSSVDGVHRAIYNISGPGIGDKTSLSDLAS